MPMVAHEHATMKVPRPTDEVSKFSISGVVCWLQLSATPEVRQVHVESSVFAYVFE